MTMITAVEGQFVNGAIEVSEHVPIQDGTRVIILLLPGEPPGNSPLGVTRTQAGRLRWRLSTIAEDWDHPDMDVYDKYEIARPATEGDRKAKE